MPQPKAVEKRKKNREFFIPKADDIDQCSYYQPLGWLPQLQPRSQYKAWHSTTSDQCMLNFVIFLPYFLVYSGIVSRTLWYLMFEIANIIGDWVAGVDCCSWPKLHYIQAAMILLGNC